MVESSSLKESGGKLTMARPFICIMSPGSQIHPLHPPMSFQLLLGPFLASSFFALDPPRSPTTFPKCSHQTQFLK
ncbi:hypothetical protein LINPERHAP2_LOCUS33061 [Linum perenne]